MATNKGMASDNHTSGGSKVKDSTGYSWNNYEGTKESHEVNATQMNSKTYDGEHVFYNQKSGVQGVAGANAERKNK